MEDENRGLFPSIGPDRPYYVLTLGGGADMSPYYWTNRDGENVMFVFSSLEEVQGFLDRRVDRNQAFLDFLEDQGLDLTESARRGEWKAGAVDSVETIATLALGMDADYLILDAGQDPPFRTWRVPDYDGEERG